MSPSAIELQNVSFGYDQRTVLEDVTLRIEHNDFVGIVGPNGGGKTTLLKLILGLLLPRDGRIEVLGRLPGQVSSQIGYMPQRVEVDPRFPVTALDVVQMGCVRLAGPYRAADRAAAREALAEVGLAEFHRRLFAELSGGQRQRVLIARAIV